MHCHGSLVHSSNSVLRASIKPRVSRLAHACAALRCAALQAMTCSGGPSLACMVLYATHAYDRTYVVTTRDVLRMHVLHCAALRYPSGDDWFWGPISALRKSAKGFITTNAALLSAVLTFLPSSSSAIGGGNNCTGGWPYATMDYLVQQSQTQVRSRWL